MSDVVLAGNESAFCSGADRRHRSSATRQILRSMAAKCALTVLRTGKPLVAASTASRRRRSACALLRHRIASTERDCHSSCERYPLPTTRGWLLREWRHAKGWSHIRRPPDRRSRRRANRIVHTLRELESAMGGRVRRATTRGATGRHALSKRLVMDGLNLPTVTTVPGVSVAPNRALAWRHHRRRAASRKRTPKFQGCRRNLLGELMIALGLSRRRRWRFCQSFRCTKRIRTLTRCAGGARHTPADHPR